MSLQSRNGDVTMETGDPDIHKEHHHQDGQCQDKRKDKCHIDNPVTVSLITAIVTVQLPITPVYHRYTHLSVLAGFPESVLNPRELHIALSLTQVGTHVRAIVAEGTQTLGSRTQHGLLHTSSVLALEHQSIITLAVL